MRGLTLRPAWAHAVAHLHKRTENRTWRPPACIDGRVIAVHSARRLLPGDDDALRAAERAAGVAGLELRALPRGCIVAVARVVGVRVGIGQVQRFDIEPHDPWFSGPVGWILADVQVLPVPVPCRGGQGLWTVPRRVVTRLRAALHNG